MISLSPSRTLSSLLTCALLALSALAHAQQVLRVTTIPEEAATEQVRKFTPLAGCWASWAPAAWASNWTIR